MKKIIQRLKSKTYWAALIGSLLTILEANSGIASTLLPPAYAKYVVLLWPAIMLTLREVTTTAISEK